MTISNPRPAPALALFTTGLWIATLLAQCGATWWFADLFTHFRVQYAVLFLLAVAWAAWCKNRPLAAAALIGLLINAAPVIAWLRPPPAVPRPSNPLALRIVSFNTYFKNEDDRGIAAYLAHSGADVIVLEEYAAQRAAGLAALLPSYPYRYADSARVAYGALIFSRWPLASARSIPLAANGAVGVGASIDVHGVPVAVFGVHLHWPMTAASAALRDREMATLAQAVGACRRRCILVGDFNSTQWSAGFRDFVRQSGLVNCAAGRGLIPTWPVHGFPLFIRIDQCLVSPDVEVVAVGTGPAQGSDHYPAVNDLALPR